MSLVQVCRGIVFIFFVSQNLCLAKPPKKAPGQLLLPTASCPQLLSQVDFNEIVFSSRRADYMENRRGHTFFGTAQQEHWYQSIERTLFFAMLSGAYPEAQLLAWLGQKDLLVPGKPDPASPAGKHFRAEIGEAIKFGTRYMNVRYSSTTYADADSMREGIRRALTSLVAMNRALNEITPDRPALTGSVRLEDRTPRGLFGDSPVVTDTFVAIAERVERSVKPARMPRPPHLRVWVGPKFREHYLRISDMRGEIRQIVPLSDTELLVVAEAESDRKIGTTFNDFGTHYLQLAVIEIPSARRPGSTRSAKAKVSRRSEVRASEAFGRVAVSPDGAYIALAAHGTPPLLFDSSTLEELGRASSAPLSASSTRFDTDPTYTAITFAKDSRKLLIATDTNSVGVYSVPALKMVDSYSEIGGKPSVNSPVLASNLEQLATRKETWCFGSGELDFLPLVTKLSGGGRCSGYTLVDKNPHLRARSEMNLYELQGRDEIDKAYVLSVAAHPTKPVLATLVGNDTRAVALWKVDQANTTVLQRYISVPHTDDSRQDVHFSSEGNFIMVSYSRGVLLLDLSGNLQGFFPSTRYGGVELSRVVRLDERRKLLFDGDDSGVTVFELDY